MKNRYYFYKNTVDGFTYESLYCLEMDQIYLGDNGDGMTSSCDDEDSLVSWAREIFGDNIEVPEDISNFIMGNGEIISSLDGISSESIREWIKSNEEDLEEV